MSTRNRLSSPTRIFDGEAWHDEAALVVRGGMVEPAHSARTTVPDGMERVEADGGMLAPGFIDLQVNGGGGRDARTTEPDVETIRTICRRTRRSARPALLPTLITDTPEITPATIAAGVRGGAAKVPGFLGLHLEGPHLSFAQGRARSGADPADDRRRSGKR